MASGKVFYSVILLFLINILCVTFASDLGVLNIGDLVTNALFDESSLNTNNVEINQDLDDGLQKELNPEADAGSLLSFVDSLQKVFSFIITLLLIGFALLNMLIQTNAPALVTTLIGLPFSIAYYISIVSAIRGYDM